MIDDADKVQTVTANLTGKNMNAVCSTETAMNPMTGMTMNMMTATMNVYHHEDVLSAR